MGTGLSLHMGGDILVEHGGTIEVDSTPGKAPSFESHCRVPQPELSPAR